MSNKNEKKVYFNTLNHILSEISLLDNLDLKASKIKVNQASF